MGMTRGSKAGLGTALAAVAEPAGQPAHNPAGLLHAALPHRSTEELVDSLLALAHEALRMNDPLFVSLPEPSTLALKAALGRDADRVRWSDSTRWHPHPVRRLRAILELVEGAERHGVGRVRLVGEAPLAATVPAMVTEWERTDALLNDALGGHPVTVVCSYDESSLPADVVGRAACSHPFVGLEPSRPSSLYLEPEEYLALVRAPASPVPSGSQVLSGTVGPGEARAFVRDTLGTSGALPSVPESVVEDMASAVTEAVVNAWQVGASEVTVACWRTAGEIGAQVDDDGPGLTDPMAGYRRPSPVTERGRGLWLARQLVDVLDIADAGPGASVRVRAFDASWSPAA